MISTIRLRKGSRYSGRKVWVAALEKIDTNPICHAIDNIRLAIFTKMFIAIVIISEGLRPLPPAPKLEDPMIGGLDER